MAANERAARQWTAPQGDDESLMKEMVRRYLDALDEPPGQDDPSGVSEPPGRDERTGRDDRLVQTHCEEPQRGAAAGDWRSDEAGEPGEAEAFVPAGVDDEEMPPEQRDAVERLLGALEGFANSSNLSNDRQAGREGADAAKEVSGAQAGDSPDEDAGEPGRGLRETGSGLRERRNDGGEPKSGAHRVRSAARARRRAGSLPKPRRDWRALAVEAALLAAGAALTVGLWWLGG